MGRCRAVTRAVDGLVELLDLEPIEVNIFRAVSPTRTASGCSAARSRARRWWRRPARSSRRRVVHSLHAYFLRPGDPTVPILYEVDRIRDGRSFTTRRVVAIQHGKAIFNLQASFQVAEAGLEHQAPMPDVPAARVAPRLQAPAGAVRRPAGRLVRPAPADRHPPRRLGPPTAERRGPPAGVAAGRRQLPDDPVLHTCVLTYAAT